MQVAERTLRMIEDEFAHSQVRKVLFNRLKTSNRKIMPLVDMVKTGKLFSLTPSYVWYWYLSIIARTYIVDQEVYLCKLQEIPSTNVCCLTSEIRCYRVSPQPASWQKPLVITCSCIQDLRKVDRGVDQNTGQELSTSSELKGKDNHILRYKHTSHIYSTPYPRLLKMQIWGKTALGSYYEVRLSKGDHF